MPRHKFSPMDFLFSGRHLAAVRRNAGKTHKRSRGRLADEGERYVSRARTIRQRRRRTARRR